MYYEVIQFLFNGINCDCGLALKTYLPYSLKLCACVSGEIGNNNLLGVGLLCLKRLPLLAAGIWAFLARMCTKRW